MRQFTGYLGGADEDICREDVDFLVTACGHYTLIKRPFFETIRESGRQDYQLLLVAGGRLCVRRGAETVQVPEGQAVIFRPGEPQRYSYEQKDSPDIFWMHFTGRRAEQFLAENGMPGSIVYTGTRPEYQELLERMIRELQLRRPGFELLCAGCGMELIALMGRADTKQAVSETDRLIEEILSDFHRNFREEQNISALARKYGISESWLIRAFRQRTGMTPQRCITGIRLQQARELLQSSALNIGEIADLCGYENALYFSRIFKKYTGASPSEYRRKKHPENFILL